MARLASLHSDLSDVLYSQISSDHQHIVEYGLFDHQNRTHTTYYGIHSHDFVTLGLSLQRMLAEWERSGCVV